MFVEKLIKIRIARATMCAQTNQLVDYSEANDSYCSKRVAKYANSCYYCVSRLFMRIFNYILHQRFCAIVFLLHILIIWRVIVLWSRKMTTEGQERKTNKNKVDKVRSCTMFSSGRFWMAVLKLNCWVKTEEPQPLIYFSFISEYGIRHRRQH